MPTRYDTDRLTEAQFEPGSRGRVLKNLPGIHGKRAMDEIEATKLAEATDWAIRHVMVDQRFTAADICQWHKQWLGKVYSWAGEYRQVNISKGSFVFAMAAQVPRLMREYERDVLGRYSPCVFDSPEEVLMALQAGLPVLNYSSIKGKQREAYFAAVRAGMGRNYAPMLEVFRKVVAASS